MKLNDTRENSRGIDENGFIINPCGLDKVKPLYREVVVDALESAISLFEGKIHSVYLYGSVGKGTAVPYHSDLDISVILFDEPDASLLERFEVLSEEVFRRNPIISKLEYDVGSYQEVMRPEERYHWHYWVKHTANLWGEDLTTQIAPFRPSIELAYGLNKDLKKRLDKVLVGLTEENARSRGKAIAKKVIRTAYSLIAEEDGSWYTDIYLCADAFSRMYPQLRRGMEWSVRMAEEGGNLEFVQSYVELIGEDTWLLFTNFTRELAVR